MEVPERTLLIYQTPSGKIPFSSRLEDLDIRTRAVVRARLNRGPLGNFGDCKAIGHGISELRIPHGPGYRVYFEIDGPILVILLCGGDKSTQKKDIEQAKRYCKEYRDAHHKLP